MAKTKAAAPLSMADRDGWIWHDGRLVPWRSATTHVLTHSLHYGLAVFEAHAKPLTECGVEEMWRGLVQLALAEYRQLLAWVGAVEAQLDALGKADERVRRLRTVPGVGPRTAEVVVAVEWKHPYTREEAAFPAPWTRAHKFWPAVGRIDNAYGDRNFVCGCPPVSDYM